MVTGSDNPLTLKAELLELAAVIVTLAPLAVKFPDADPLDPSATLPMLRVPGETASWPAEPEEPEEPEELDVFEEPALLTP